MMKNKVKGATIMTNYVLDNIDYPDNIDTMIYDKKQKKPFLKAQLGALNPPKLAQKSFKNLCKKKHRF